MAAVTLKRTGQKMPLVGLGLWKIPNATTADAVYNAIKLGYRLLDGASDYGNEQEAGEGVHRAIKDGLVKREELFITSKVWNAFHKYEHVKQAAKMSLGFWGLDYFDLLLVHFPISLKYIDPAERHPCMWWVDSGLTKVELQKTPYHETWKAFEELIDEGLAKNIGVSNVRGAQLVDIHTYARYEPQVLQIEHHPYLTQQPLVSYVQDVCGMAVTAYSSFGPQSYLELGIGGGVQSLFEHEVIKGIAKAHGKSTAQVLLRWATQRSVAVIPKSNHQGRLVENLNINDFTLSPEELKAISGLDRNLRFNNPVDIDPRLAIFA